MSVRANLLGLTFALLVGITMCLMLFSKRSWFDGPLVGLLTGSLYISGLYVGQADVKRSRT